MRAAGRAPDLVASSEDHANVPVLPPVLFGIALALGYGLRWLLPIGFVPPAAARPAEVAGMGLSFVAAVFGAWALLAFRRARTTPHPNHPVSALVTSGPYRVSRNPMYVGMSAAVIGFALVANSVWLLLILPPVWLLLRRLVIDREEAYLERRFGEDYRGFKARTRRWL